MRRVKLAPAFVTTVLTSGCAWTYGGSVQYSHAIGESNGVSASARGAWGFGGARNALVIATDLSLGVSPSEGHLWAQTMPRLEWSWLPRDRDFGLRLAGGGFLGGTAARGYGLLAGPLLGAEALYGLNVQDDEQRNGYRGTLLGFGAYFAYDLAGEVNTPIVILGLSITRDGTVPFGNPPPPRFRPETVQVAPASAPLQVATDPAP
jgi:hypothetical protein